MHILVCLEINCNNYPGNITPTVKKIWSPKICAALVLTDMHLTVELFTARKQTRGTCTAVTLQMVSVRHSELHQQSAGNTVHRQYEACKLIYGSRRHNI
jgi:hypothetical protein